MHKIAVDPTLVSTPIGAAIGLALVRTLFTEKERTVGKYLAGGGLGAGVGYAAGELYKANKPIGITGKSDADWLLASDFTGKGAADPITETERELAVSLYRTGVVIPEEKSWRAGVLKYKQRKFGNIWADATVYRMRATVNKIKAEQTNNFEEKKNLLALVKQNEEKAEQMIKQGTPGILNEYIWTPFKGWLNR